MIVLFNKVSFLLYIRSYFSAYSGFKLFTSIMSVSYNDVIYHVRFIFTLSGKLNRSGSIQPRVYLFYYHAWV
jgi:hypothetical protein